MPFRVQPQGFMWARGFFSLVIILIVVAVAIWIALMLSREWGRSHVHVHSHGVGEPSAVAHSEALRILDERFAKGEIGAEEFTSRRDLLRSTS